MGIDYLKILILENHIRESLLCDNRLMWVKDIESLKKDLEEIQTNIIRVHNGILFCFYENKLEILFKPHYHYNDNLHNANDFSVMDCIATMQVLRGYSINYNTAKIINIEFGLNFIIKNYGKELITFTEYHKRDQFRNDNDLAFSKKSYSFNKWGRANKFKTIKFYSKGVQYPEYCNIDTQRLEIKSKQSKYIKTLGIVYLKDLLDISVYEQMQIEIINVVEHLLILDYKTGFNNLNNREITKLKEYLSSYTWYASLQKNRNEFTKKKNRYFNLLNKTEINIHTELKKIIVKKLKELSPSVIEKGAYSTPKQITEKGAYSTSYINGIRTLSNNRICPITGVSLKHEKEESKYIRTATLKHLQNNDENKFIELCSFLLSNTKYSRPKFEKDIISHLSKQVRNKTFNKKRIKQIGYRKKEYKNKNQLKLAI